MPAMDKFEKLSNRFDRLSARLEWLENKYYHWQHYFEIKKKRVENRWATRAGLWNKFKHLENLLKNLSIKQVKGTGHSVEKDFHILRLSYNDIRRLRYLLRSRNFMGRLTRKEGGELFYLTIAEKSKLQRLLKRDWRIK